MKQTKKQIEAQEIADAIQAPKALGAKKEQLSTQQFAALLKAE